MSMDNRTDVVEQAATVAARATWRALSVAFAEHGAAVDALAAILTTESLRSPSYPWARDRLDAARQQVTTCWWLHFGEAPPPTIP